MRTKVKKGEFTKVELTCRDCGKSFLLDIDDEMYDNDYDITCDNCDREQSISSYDYSPLYDFDLDHYSNEIKV